MDSEFQPPVHRSMSDSDLEAALESAKNQADGMLAAMMLLEQESQLRAEDEAATAVWLEAMRNDPRPEARLAAENFERRNAGLEPLLEVVPEPDQVTPTQMPPAVAYESFVEPNPVEDVISPEPVDQFPARSFTEPEPIPAPVLEEAAFDELLALGAAEATSGIQVIDTLADAPEQAATAYEEIQSESVVPSTTVVLPGSRLRNWVKVLSGSLTWSIVVPVAAVLFARSTSASLASILVGSAAGLLVAFGLSLVIDRMRARGSASLSVLSRATFGVFGNILPTVFIVAFRFALLVIVVVALAQLPAKTIAGVNLSDQWLSVPATAWVAVCLALVAAVLALLPKIYLRWFSLVALASALAWVVALPIGIPAALNFGSLDLSAVASLTVMFSLGSIALTGLEAKASGAPSRLPIKLALRVVLPLITVFLVGAANVTPPTFDQNVFASIVFASPAWLGTLSNVVLGIASVALVAQLLVFAGEAWTGLFVANRRFNVAIVLVKVLATVIGGVFFSVINNVVSAIVFIALAPVATWVGMILVEALLRRQTFHEVSLARGYAFYKSVSVIALIGYLISLGFNLAVTQIYGVPFLGLAAQVLDAGLVFGQLSGAVYGFAFGALYTLITASPKIHRQEQEISGVFERKAQIAGVELPE